MFNSKIAMTNETALTTILYFGVIRSRMIPKLKDHSLVVVWSQYWLTILYTFGVTVEAAISIIQ